jgi:hypothetical protein
MKCPHCLVEFYDHPESIPLGNDVEAKWSFIRTICPACKRVILQLVSIPGLDSVKGTQYPVTRQSVRLVWPKVPSRTPLPREVPTEFAQDYAEACLVLTDSPKASAALSRRCLQHILREKGGVNKTDLADEIQQVIDSGKLPSHITESLDAVRNIGNFAAHPIKSRTSGEVVDVEPGEAEWNLDVLESLFDFFFVQPEVIKKKRDALNRKLGEVGKPPMK